MKTPPADPDVRPIVDRLIDDAVRRRASDLHLEPTREGYEARARVDGLLAPIEAFPRDVGRAAVVRLMVLAKLLTYRLDVPQEGRLSAAPPSSPAPLELRLSVMPTTHGLRAVLRLPAELIQPTGLDDLGLPDDVLVGLRAFAAADAGMLLLVGPAGSGKTTTIYALLRHIVRTQPGLSVIALEDPVERDLPGVTQIEVSPFGQLTYEKALRSILRQDPQVLMLGEIRDAATASIAVQAALSGHKLISTLHASTAAGAIARLAEMGLEPYQVTSALYGVVAQRLLRVVRPADNASAPPVYSGRRPIAEFVRLGPAARRAVLDRADAATLQTVLSAEPGYRDLWVAADALASSGVTDVAEVRRVLGVRGG